MSMSMSMSMKRKRIVVGSLSSSSPPLSSSSSSSMKRKRTVVGSLSSSSPPLSSSSSSSMKRKRTVVGSLSSSPSSSPSSSSSMKRKRTVVGSLSSTSSSKFDDSEVYLLYSLFSGPVRYVMYKIDTSAIGNDSRRIRNCTAVFELPSQKYPLGMGSFALGSRIYLLGGEVGRHHEVDFVPSSGWNTTRISEKVYFFDTAVSSSSSSPLSVAPPMGGGKIEPRAIQANGFVYIISDLPDLCTTYFSEGEPLFEVFKPQGGNEGEGEWSSLPRPPFYPRSSDAGSEETDGARRIISHAVLGQLIYFFTGNQYHCRGIEAVYAFDVLSCHWEHVNDYDPLSYRLPHLRQAAMQVSDSVWVGLSSLSSRSPISSFDLSANFGVVGRDVEGLESCYFHTPLLAYYTSDRLLDMGNGWFCLLKFGTDKVKDNILKGRQYIFATVFRLVKKCKDKVSFDESGYWLGRTLSSPPNVPRDVSKAVGEIQVFGAEELRSSFFAPGVENFNTIYHSVGFFAMKKECTPSYYQVGLCGTECD